MNRWTGDGFSQQRHATQNISLISFSSCMLSSWEKGDSRDERKTVRDLGLHNAGGEHIGEGRWDIGSWRDAAMETSVSCCVTDCVLLSSVPCQQGKAEARGAYICILINIQHGVGGFGSSHIFLPLRNERTACYYSRWIAFWDGRITSSEDERGLDDRARQRAAVFGAAGGERNVGCG